MENITFKVLNLILSNLDDKPSSIQPIQGYEDIYTVNFDNGEVAQVEVFPENEGINFHWVKVNHDRAILDKVYNQSKGEVLGFKGTKGQFEVSYSRGIGTRVYVNNKGNIKTICTLNQNNHEDSYNARLFKKSPEMLDFLNRLSGEMLRNDFVLDEKWYDQAQQLIKSATQI